MSTKKKEYTYQDFLESEETKAAANQRKKIEASKPSSFSYSTYTQSDAVKQAQDKLNQHTQNKPGAYTSQWQTSLNDTLNKILNREKFTYDLNADALYNQYKNQATTQGMQAMMDTMGQAQAMTGGYGNSYAQTAGQQTYQGYMQQLNDRIPELYQLALNQYNQEGENLYNQYGLYADRENQDYSRYRDQLSDYNTELNRLTEDSRYQSETDYNRYMDQYNMAYGQYRDTVSDWQTALNRADSEYWNQYNKDYGQYSDDRNFDYGKYRDQMADAQWQQNFDYQKEQDALAQQNWQTQFDYGKEQDALAQKNWQAQFDYGKAQDALAQQQWQTQFDYAKQQDLTAQQQWQQNFDYQKQLDALANQQWQTQFDYAKAQDALAQKQWQAEFDEAIRQFNLKNGIVTSSAVGIGGNGGTNNTTPVSSNEAVKAAQKFVGTDVDGQWGPKSKSAAKAMGFDSMEAVLDYLGITINGDRAPASVEDNVRSKAAYGAERNEIMRYLKAAMDAEEISADEYIRLMSAYASAGM